MSFTIATTHAKTSVRNSKTIIKMNIMTIINYGLMVKWTNKAQNKSKPN